MKKLISLASRLVCTFFGSGYFPIAPGTAGSLAAIPLIYWSKKFSGPEQLALWCFVFVLGLWGTKKYCEETGSKDPGVVVIDEVLGMAIALSMISTNDSTIKWVVAFFLFRFFDVIKIFPARQLDRASKKYPHYLGAFYIIADDLAAGLQALLVFYVLLAKGLIT